MGSRLNLNRRKRALSFESLEARLAPAANPIVAENLLPGNPQSQWDIVGSGDPTLQGYATDISVDQGQTVSFKIDDQTSAPYRIEIYRIGYYQGNGARLVATIPSSATLRQVQAAPLKDLTTGLTDAGNWAVSASWAVPARPFRECTSPSWSGRTPAGPATSHSSSATTTASPTSSCRRRTPPGRRTTTGGGTACTRRRPPARPPTRTASPAGTRSATTGRSIPAASPPAGPPGIPAPIAGSSTANTRWSGSWRPTGTTSATRPTSTPIVAGPSYSSTSCSCPWGMTSTGPGPIGPTSRRPATPGSTWPSSPATRCTGRPGGRPAPKGPTPRTARWSRTRRPRPTPRSTRAAPGPAPGGTCASAPRTTGAGRRTS